MATLKRGFVVVLVDVVGAVFYFIKDYILHALGYVKNVDGYSMDGLILVNGQPRSIIVITVHKENGESSF